MRREKKRKRSRRVDRRSGNACLNRRIISITIKKHKADAEKVKEGKYQKEEEVFEKLILQDLVLRDWVLRDHIRLLQDLETFEG